MSELAETTAVAAPKVALGSLEVISPRNVWAHEAGDFTPWLLSNADRLAEALGIDLELTAAEHAVGGFSLDLVGRDLTNDAVLIVENQLEGTNHAHLGQLLTYAAGTGAATIVWVATAFRDEHRQALDWLNEQTSADVHFFGVQVKVVRIGDSLPAPLFEVVAEPNDWAKRVRDASRADTQASPRQQLYRDFWARYLERIQEKRPTWTKARIPQAANWMTQPSPIPGGTIVASFAKDGRLRHEITFGSPDASENEAALAAMLAKRELLEDAYGAELTFEELPGRKATRVAAYGVGDISDGDSYDEFIVWFIDAGDRLRKALAAYLNGVGS